MQQVLLLQTLQPSLIDLQLHSHRWPIHHLLKHIKKTQTLIPSVAPTVHLHPPDDKKGPSPPAPRTRSPTRTAPTPSPNQFHTAPTTPFAWTKLTQHSHIKCAPCLELRACILSVRRRCAWSAPSFMYSFLARCNRYAISEIESVLSSVLVRKIMGTDIFALA